MSYKLAKFGGVASDRALSRALCFPNGPAEENVPGLAMEQLSNEPTQSSAAQPQENHMGLANMTLVPLSEPPSATGSNGSQDSQRRRSHASPSSPNRSREIIKAINDLTTRVCGAMAESQARIDTTIESLASLVASTKAMAEAQKMAAAQRHADSEKLLAAIANKNNYVPGASSDA